MTTTHTPGPWTVWTGAPDREPRILSNAGRHAVAAVKLASHREHDANARLIAAAPDLLVALDDAWRSLDRLAAEPDNKHARAEATRVAMAARAAIAKAEGRE